MTRRIWQVLKNLGGRARGRPRPRFRCGRGFSNARVDALEQYRPVRRAAGRDRARARRLRSCRAAQRLKVETTAVPLIGQRRVRKTVAEYDAALRQRGTNYFRHVLGACSVDEKSSRSAPRSQVQSKKICELRRRSAFRPARALRLRRDPPTQAVRKPDKQRALATALDALDYDEH